MDKKITLEQVDELYKLLQGEVPENVTMKRPPRLSQRQAFKIIWYLQEQMRIIPDKYERCVKCGDLYNADAEGGVRRDRCYCDHCY